MGVPWRDSGMIGQPARRAHGAQRVLCVKDLAGLKPNLDHCPSHRDVRAVRLREHQLGCIQIGGIGALVPDRKHDLARLGFGR